MQTQPRFFRGITPEKAEVSHTEGGSVELVQQDAGVEVSP